jgi:hypothetical protein
MLLAAAPAIDSGSRVKVAMDWPRQRAGAGEP